MKDKNNVQVKAGDIVRIEGAFFKNDNGLYYVEQDGTNKAYCGGDNLTLYKICKNGKLSTTKHNICFFPIHSTVSDYVKTAQANAWNKEHATIEVVYNVDNSNVIERFEEEARRAKEASDYYKLRGYSESYTKSYYDSFEYYHAAVERMKAEKEQTKEEEKPLNSMCLNCACLGNDCTGSHIQVFTGCIYKQVKTEETVQKPQEEPETMADNTNTTAEVKELEKATANAQEEGNNKMTVEEAIRKTTLNKGEYTNGVTFAESEPQEEWQPELPTDNYFIENMETGKIELHFEKSAYMALSEDQKKEIKSNFLFSRYSSAWVSRCKFPHTYRAKEIAKKLGLADGGKTGETLSFEEQQENKAEKAERRAERMEYRAEKAQERGECLQKPINDMRGDIAFFTQPNINSSAGKSFTRRREKMWAAWESGFNEFKKSDYYKERANQARQTAQQTRPTDKGFIQRRIDDAEKTIRVQKKNIKEYEDILEQIENGETLTMPRGNLYTVEKLTEYIEHHNRILEDAMSKAIYYYECMEEVGGVSFNKSNVKKGCYAIIDRWGKVEVIGTGLKNITYRILTGGAAGFGGKASYAEIKEILKE